MNDTKLVTSATLISRIAGLLRDISIAHIFGASQLTNAFFVAFKLPNFFRRLFAEGAFSQALMPEFSQSEQPQVLFQALWPIFIITTLTLVLVLELFSPFLVKLIGFGFSNNLALYDLTLQLFRLMIPFSGLILLTGLFAAVLNSQKKFIYPAFMPLVLNICLLLTLWLINPLWFRANKITLLAWSVSIAGLMQAFILLGQIKRLGWPVYPKFNLAHKISLRNAFKLKFYAPILATMNGNLMQLSLLAAIIFAGFFENGSISWLYYSERLISLPLGLVSAVLSSVTLSHFSQKTPNYKQRSENLTKNQVLFKQTIQSLLILGLPATLGLIILAKPIVITIYYSGHFSIYDASQTQYCLIAFALGLPAFLIAKLLTTQMNSEKKPEIGCLFMAFSLLIAIALMFLFKQYQAPGLALTISIAAWFNAILLISYNKSLVCSSLSRLFIGKLLGALVPLILYLICCQKLIALTESQSYWQRWLILIIIISLAKLIYLLTLKCIENLSKR